MVSVTVAIHVLSHSCLVTRMRSKTCWRRWRTVTRNSRRNWRRKCEAQWTFVHKPNEHETSLSFYFQSSNSPTHLRMDVPVFIPHTSALWFPLWILFWAVAFICVCVCVMWFLCFLLWCGCLCLLVPALLWLSLCLASRMLLGKEQQENKGAIHDSQQKLSETSAVSLSDPPEHSWIS